MERPLWRPFNPSNSVNELTDIYNSDAPREIWGGASCPLPLSFHSGRGRRLAEASDINPLTLPKHTCYYPHRSNTNLTISRRNQKPREAHPRTQRLSPSRGAVSAVPGSSKRRHLLIPKTTAIPSLTSRRWKAHRLYAAGPVQRRPCRFNAPHHRVRLPRPIACRFPR